MKKLYPQDYMKTGVTDIKRSKKVSEDADYKDKEQIVRKTLLKFEKILVRWLNFVRQQNVSVSGVFLERKKKNMELADELNFEDFSDNNVWLEYFCKTLAGRQILPFFKKTILIKPADFVSDSTEDRKNYVFKDF